MTKKRETLDLDKRLSDILFNYDDDKNYSYEEAMKDLKQLISEVVDYVIGEDDQELHGMVVYRDSTINNKLRKEQRQRKAEVLATEESKND